MGHAITIFAGSSGLNTKLDPVRTRFNPDTGIAEMQVAVNVELDDTGRVSRRKGYEATAVTDPVHSLWCDGKDAYCVTGGNLCRINGDLTLSVLETVQADAQVSYAMAGNRTYYINGFQKGILENGAASDWAMDGYEGPVTNKELMDPPMGRIVRYFAGRMWIAEKNVLWFSQPGAYAWFRRGTDAFMFDDDVLMVEAVADGLWVSTVSKLWFLSGVNPEEMHQQRVTDYPAVEGTACRVPGRDVGSAIREDIGDGSLPGWVWVFVTAEGVCLGGPGGYLRNLTQDKVVLPVGRYGSAVYDGGKYIACMET